MLVVLLLAPTAAQAGTAISSVPNLPGGARSGGAVTVGETGLPGTLAMTQTFNGSDASATARLRLIRLAVNCGPGPSPGNPTANGPAINSPERPCTNPDPGVFANLSPTGIGRQACLGITFTITAPDVDGQVDMLPNFPVDLRSGETCEIDFSFDVLSTPARDTFPNAAGMQTTSVSSVRSEVISDPGNPAAIGLQAAGLGSGDAVLVEPAVPPSIAQSPPPGADTDTPKKRQQTDVPTRLRVPLGCVKTKLNVSVAGSDITKVTFKLDGRVVDVDKTAPFKLNTVIPGLRTGAHRLTATVVYRPASGTPNRVMGRKFFRCQSPNFTG